MDEQLDNDLKNRIREVFDNIEDPAADEGWLQLRKKFPGERRPAFAWMWWSAAAILCLFMGIGLWLYNTKDQPGKFAVKTSKHPQSENLAATKRRKDSIAGKIAANTEKPNKTVPGSLAAGRSGNLKIATAKKHGTNGTVTAPKMLKDTAGNKNFMAKNKVGNKNITVRQQSQLAATKPSGNKGIVGRQQLNQVAIAKQPDNKNIAGRQQPNQVAANIQPDNKNIIAANKQAAAKPVIVQPASRPATAQPTNPEANTLAGNAVTKPAAVQPKQSKSINSMFAQDRIASKKTIDERPKRVSFGVYAATYFNYARGSNNQANLGAGITSEIKISKNLKLVTGLTIAQNSLNFSGGLPTSVAQTNVSQTIYSVPGANTASAYSLASAVTVATVPAFKNYDASLVGLDVPLNLKYDFNPKHMDAYVLAGLSSGTFINETYTYQYNYPALHSASLQQIQNQTTHQSFNGFYFGKTLNVAVGLGYPLGRNHLVLEPFLKYPLDGLGSQNIRFGAGGVNLKFNFQTGKK